MIIVLYLILSPLIVIAAGLCMRRVSQSQRTRKGLQIALLGNVAAVLNEMPIALFALIPLPPHISIRPMWSALWAAVIAIITLVAGLPWSIRELATGKDLPVHALGFLLNLTPFLVSIPAMHLVAMICGIPLASN